MRAIVAALALGGCGGVAATVPPAVEIPVAPATVRAERGPIPTPPPAARTPPPAPPPEVDGCPADMVAVGRFCIDRYEAPNEKGEVPFALRTAYDGEAWCAARGKRLCREDEWLRACAGPHGRTYPYGNDYRGGTCNDDHPWLGVSWKKLARWPDDAALGEATRLFQADMSGARAGCVTEEGAFDMTGNVAEWVRKTSAGGRPGYEHALKGCYWAGCFKDPRASCAFTNGAHPGTFRTYEAGFRCCTPRASAVTSPP